MRFRAAIVAAAIAMLCACAGCKDTTTTLPPSPSALINGTRERLTPFRFTLTTDPEFPHSQGPTRIKIHVNDGSGEPVSGATVSAELSQAGAPGSPRHIELDDRGQGNYEGDVNLDSTGSWAVDVKASKDGKNRELRLYVDVVS